MRIKECALNKKRFAGYSLFNSQSVFRFSLSLHFHTSCSYRVHKSCSCSFKISREMIQEQAVAVVIIALISEQNESREKRQKGKVCVKPWLNREI